MEINSRQKDFIGTLSAVINTDNGKKLFKYLLDEYVSTSCLQQSPELTYYKLGQKELIQGLIADSKVPLEEIEDIKVIRGDI